MTIKGICLSIGLTVMISCGCKPDACEIRFEKMSGFPFEDSCFHKGVSALYAGILDGNIIMAGGCNFPDIPAADGGQKVFYEDIYCSPLPEDTLFQWKKIGQLPHAMAYGVTIPTEKGLILAGGTTSACSLSDVFLLSFQDGLLMVEILHSLPEAIDNMGGALLEHTVYIVGGNVDGIPSSDVYALDLLNISRGWRKETEVPGKPRVQPVCVAQSGKLYVWGGFAPAYGDCGPSVSVDGYVYTPETKEWASVETPCDTEGNAISLGGGVGIPFGEDNVLCAGGVNKDIFLKALQGIYKGKEYLSHPAEWYRFNRNLLLYDTKTDEWTVLGNYEQVARAGAAMVSQGDNCYIINGELKPGVRTNKINRIKK